MNLFPIQLKRGEKEKEKEQQQQTGDPPAGASEEVPPDAPTADDAARKALTNPVSKKHLLKTKPAEYKQACAELGIELSK